MEILEIGILLIIIELITNKTDFLLMNFTEIIHKRFLQVMVCTSLKCLLEMY